MILFNLCYLGHSLFVSLCLPLPIISNNYFCATISSQIDWIFPSAYPGFVVFREGGGAKLTQPKEITKWKTGKRQDSYEPSRIDITTWWPAKYSYGKYFVRQWRSGKLIWFNLMLRFKKIIKFVTRLLSCIKSYYWMYCVVPRISYHLILLFRTSRISYKKIFQRKIIRINSGFNKRYEMKNRILKCIGYQKNILKTIGLMCELVSLYLCVVRKHRLSRK